MISKKIIKKKIKES